MLLLDNWNEWGEGHYLAPYREYGFGYLDAVRRVFSDAPEAHDDLIPEDVGLGPYDRAYVAHRAREKERARLRARKVTRPGPREAGLIGWWSFDEAGTNPVAYDWTGGGIGGDLLGARRAPGIAGRALVCDGGCVVVPANPRLSPDRGLTVSCWIRTDTPNQDNTWFVNKVYGGGEATGYRMGVLAGKPCFEAPLTAWSHHLQADGPLPVGRWVHVAGTFDGRTMRIYVDGEPRGELARPGPIRPNGFPLCLGSYDKKHPAYFRGLLDEVKLYDRALTPAEIRADYRRGRPVGGP